MRVAHMTSAHSRDDVRVFLKECRSLAGAGHDVTLIVADGLGDDVCSQVAIRDAGASSGRANRMLGAPRRVYRLAVEADADVYHLHDPELLPLCPLLKRRGKRVIFDAHEDVPKQILGKHYLPRMLRGSIAGSFAIFERFICRYTDGIIAATPTIREKFQAFHSHVEDVNNFPLVGELDPPKQHKLSGTGVCYIGSIAGIRGIREVVRALELSRSDAHLLLAGGFAETDTEAEVRAAAGWCKVEYLGILGREGVKEVLAGSVAGLVTLYPTANYLDSLPIKMFEYMAAGIPVIASNFPLWREIVDGNHCGVCVDPKDPAAIAAAIDDFVLDPVRASAMGDNGRRAVLGRYNWDREESKLLAFYGRLEAAGA
ncbi:MULTISPECIES: glycosyltransferase family 4 protein [unclassified Agrobacterium]|uniref:glycosyltransferase family 4 protein n=1 Tax=unclassified Agrobacterium TaxID=2632611 RepID=UPI00083D0BD4|nr:MULTISPECIES: glycosyltransferase family 4 protein [unclassified Agrobacterium]AOG12836.1 glycosyl transferase 4-like domain protein [Agrobacterium sp. RAC06]QGG93514.1 glycosyltransferase [Agrobacterium sp. MA01]